MRAFESESRLHHEDQITIPHAIAAQLKDGQRVRIVMMVIDVDTDYVIEEAPPPYAKLAGRWDPNDPRIEAWKKCVEEYRREVDADPSVP